MASYTYSGVTKQQGTEATNKIVALKVDTTQSEWFSILAETTANVSGEFTLSWDDWDGRIIVGAVDNDITDKLDCVFHDFQFGTESTGGGSSGITSPTFANLKLYYKFDETASGAVIDSSPEGNNGTQSSTVAVPGVSNDGKEFGASGAKVNTNSPLPGGTQFSLSFFVKLASTSTDSNQTLLALGDYGFSATNNWDLSRSVLEEGDLIFTQVQDEMGSRAFGIETEVFNTSTFVHVGITVDGTQAEIDVIKMYIDGVSAGSYISLGPPFSGTIAADPDTLYVGAKADGNRVGIVVIDELRYFANYVASPAEMLELATEFA